MAGRSKPPVVRIACTTCNYEKDMWHAVGGFLIQERAPTEIVIHDDASTESNLDIVREWAAKCSNGAVGVYWSENQCSRGRGRFVDSAIARRGSDYIGTCRGEGCQPEPLAASREVGQNDKAPAR